MRRLVALLLLAAAPLGAFLAQSCDWSLNDAGR
jgi:hypothetical protein